LRRDCKFPTETGWKRSSSRSFEDLGEAFILAVENDAFAGELEPLEPVVKRTAVARGQATTDDDFLGQLALAKAAR